MNIADALDAITKVLGSDRTIWVAWSVHYAGRFTLLVFAYACLRWAISLIINQDFDRWELVKPLIHYIVLSVVLANWTLCVQSVTNEVAYLRHMIEHGQEDTVFQSVTKITTDVRSAAPILPSITDTVEIWILTIALSIFEAAVYFVLTFGYIMTALCEIFGPIALALSMFPMMTWLGWGWFRAFLGYASYPLFAAAYIDIVAQLLTYFMRDNPGPWSVQELSIRFAGFLMMLVAVSLGVWKLASGIADMFSGRVGTSTALSWRLSR